MKFIASEIFWNDCEFRAIYLFVYILFPCISRKKVVLFKNCRKNRRKNEHGIRKILRRDVISASLVGIK